MWACTRVCSILIRWDICSYNAGTKSWVSSRTISFRKDGSDQSTLYNASTWFAWQSSFKWFEQFVSALELAYNYGIYKHFTRVNTSISREGPGRFSHLLLLTQYRLRHRESELTTFGKQMTCNDPWSISLKLSSLVSVRIQKWKPQNVIGEEGRRQ